MDSSKKKALLVKTKAVKRVLKEYMSYEEEVNAYDLIHLAQDKRQSWFYN